MFNKNETKCKVENVQNEILLHKIKCVRNFNEQIMVINYSDNKIDVSEDFYLQTFVPPVSNKQDQFKPTHYLFVRQNVCLFEKHHPIRHTSYLMKCNTPIRYTLFTDPHWGIRYIKDWKSFIEPSSPDQSVIVFLPIFPQGRKIPRCSLRISN